MKLLKYCLFLIFYCALFQSCFLFSSKSDLQKNKHAHTIKVDDVFREFIIKLPTYYDEAVDYPVVFVFHGLGQNDQKAFSKFGWVNKAQQEGFITVFPQALEYEFMYENEPASLTAWDDGRFGDTNSTLYEENDFAYMDPNTQQNFQDDILFVERIVEYIKSIYSTDSEKYYATGFSNGGNFVWRLAIEKGDIFKAFAPNSGALQLENQIQNIASPVYASGGNNDTLFKILNNINVPIPMNPDAIITALEPNINWQLDALELEDNYIEMPSNDPNQFILRWENRIDPQAEHYYQLMIFGNTGHIYPKRTNNTGGMNPERYHAADIYWEFFESVN